MKKKFIIILLFIFFSLIVNAKDGLKDKFGDVEIEMLPVEPSDNTNNDIPEESELDKAIKEYKSKVVTVYSYQLQDKLTDEGLKEKFGSREIYALYRGDKSKTKISELLGEMGSSDIAKKVALAEYYNVYLGILIPSAILSATLDIVGIISIISGTTNLFAIGEGSIGIKDERLFYLGVGLLSGSVLTIASMIVSTVLIIYSNKYRYNINQAKAIVNRYNSFLKERLKIPIDLNISYNLQNSSTSFALSFRF